MHRRRSGLGVLAAFCAVVLLAGCGVTFPRDAQGVLDRATGGTLYVGVTANPPYTVVGPDGSVSGTEVELISAYAESIDAEVVWTAGAEHVLAGKMEQDELDLVIGGLTSSLPFTSKIALSRPYTSTTGPGGSQQKIVVGARPGENALLVSVERFLAEQTGDIAAAPALEVTSR